MFFELTDALVNDILFSMEDQEGEFLVDTHDGVVAGGPDFVFDDDSGERFIDLPGWDSSDGYRLMERFTASFRNPLIRGELTRALNQGKGVFRAFKDTLTLYPEAEKHWFAYKEREMKREILRWYNGLREEWGMERIGSEPEETGDLLLEDFRFREGGEGDIPAAEALHRYCLEAEGRPPVPFFGGDWEPWSFPGDVTLVAETGGGEFAAYISAIRKGQSLYVKALEVRAEYRGLGLGEELLSLFMESAEGRGASTVTVDLPAGTEGFSRVLLRKFFRSWSTRYYAELRGPSPKEAGKLSSE